MSSDPFGFARRWSNTGFGSNDAPEFANMVRQQMGTGPAEGNGGYATGQSPAEKLRKAQEGLIKAQTGEAQGQADRLGLLNNMFAKPGAFKAFQAGDMDAFSKMLSWGIPQGGTPGAIRFPGQPTPQVPMDETEMFRPSILGGRMFNFGLD